MLENLVKVGAPSFLPKAAGLGGGGGGACSQGVIDGFANVQAKYLPFVRNGINWVASGGRDVVSGPFSGCIMAAYSENGVAKICHVSTGAEFGDCKAAWDVIKARSTNVVEFRPSDLIGDTPGATCYGLITSDLQLYTILVSAKRVLLPPDGKTDRYAEADAQFVKLKLATAL